MGQSESVATGKKTIIGGKRGNGQLVVFTPPLPRKF